MNQSKVSICASDLLVECLESEGVEIVFGVVGEHVDAVFDAIKDSDIKVVACRHEQNAAYMAGLYGRLTNKAGVVLASSGPGVANLCSGLLTATTEGDPVVVIGGGVSTLTRHRVVNQKVDNVSLMSPVTKLAQEITAGEVIPEIVRNAFRVAEEHTCGAVFLSLPQDISYSDVPLTYEPIVRPPTANVSSVAQSTSIYAVVDKLLNSENPILLLGQEASRPEVAREINILLDLFRIPVVSTFQGVGCIEKRNKHCFVGRVGPFTDASCTTSLKEADLVLAIGYNPIECEPDLWAEGKDIIEISYVANESRNSYRPSYILTGNIDSNIFFIRKWLHQFEGKLQFNNIYPTLSSSAFEDIHRKEGKVHPLDFCSALNKCLDSETIICCDVGTVQIWLARYLLCHYPRQIVFSNGQQTSGVGLPWGIAAKLTFPNKKVISISGDGGFLRSSMELDTAVREGLSIKHFIWNDACCDKIKQQQLIKYNREMAVSMNFIDFENYAKSFWAEGKRITKAEQLADAFQDWSNIGVPQVYDVVVDYSDNHMLYLNSACVDR